jgi:hypothetical protein
LAKSTSLIDTPTNVAIVENDIEGATKEGIATTLDLFTLGLSKGTIKLLLNTHIHVLQKNLISLLEQHYFSGKTIFAILSLQFLPTSKVLPMQYPY